PVVRLGKIGNQETPAIVGDDELGEFRRKVVGFGHDPAAALRTVRAVDDAADVAGAAGALRAQAGGQKSRENAGHEAQVQSSSRLHESPFDAAEGRYGSLISPVRIRRSPCFS